MLRREIQKAVDEDRSWADHKSIVSLEKLSVAIVRAVEALKKSADLAEEFAARLTPEQLLEAAVRKIESQDLATLTYAIKRLRAHRQRLGPVSGQEARAMADVATATDAIASLK
jgi:hypothetical protein